MRALLASVFLLGLGGTAYAADCSPLQIENSVKMMPLNRGNLVLLPITLNGVEKKFRFATAAAISSVSQSTAKELNLPSFHSRTRLIQTRGQDSTDFVQVHEVGIGTAKSNGVQFQLVADYGAPGGPAPFDGELAAGIFLHDDFDLDFGAERLNFFSPDHCEGKVVYWPHQVLSVIPVTEEQSHIDVPVTLDGHQLRATINTGIANTSLRLTRAREVFNFSPDAPTTGNHPADNPQREIYPRRFSSLSFDGVTVQNPLIVVQPMEYGRTKDNDMTLGSHAEHKDDTANRLSADLVIGMDILRHLHIYFASRESKLYVTEAGQGESVLFKTAEAPAK